MRPSGDERITRQFEQRSAWWDRIYQETSLVARVLRRRQQVALTWADSHSRLLRSTGRLYLVLARKPEPD